MSYSEHLSCNFGLRSAGDGSQPSHVDIDIYKGGDFANRKQIARIFLTFKKTATISEAEELEAMMNRCLQGLCIVHRAAGENS